MYLSRIQGFKDQVTQMLFRKHTVSTRMLFQLTAVVVFASVGIGTAVAANPPIAPLLVPYTMNTIAGDPQYGQGTTAVTVGYFGEGVPGTSILQPDGKTVKQGGTMNQPYGMAVDSVGNVYITDTGNSIIREVNAQTGLITTVAGQHPTGCSGVVCTLKFQKGCADGVAAFGAPIGSAHIQGIAVDAYGNVYFDDNTDLSVSVIYRGGTRVANFIKLVNPAGVAKSGGNVVPGYVYHIAGNVDLTTCSGSAGTVDNAMAFQDNSNPPTGTGYPAAQFKSTDFISLDSAGNIYIADHTNATVRVINTQATDQTFFQYTVHPGYMRSITNCNAILTAPCPTGTITATANTGINGPANQLVFQSQYKNAQVDAYGNIYEMIGTGGSVGPPGYYSAAIYAGGAPLTNLLVVEAPNLAPSYPTPPELNPTTQLPTYGAGYDFLGNPTRGDTLPGQTTGFPDVMATGNGQFAIRPGAVLPDNFGTIWFLDTHFPELNRIDQYTSLATLTAKTGRATTSLAGIQAFPASFAKGPWYCVYGSASSSNPLPWTSGPQTYDPQGDGCPAILAIYSGGSSTISDGVGNLFAGDGNENLEREITVNNAFPPTPVGTATPVVQPIQVHFNSNNPPAIGAAIQFDGPVVGITTSAFSIPPGSIPDFTIDTTDPGFPMGSILGSGGYSNTSKTNFALWAGLPTCTQLGNYTVALGITDYDCLVYVAFKPTAPGFRQSQLKVTAGVTTSNPNGNVYYFSLTGIGTGGQLAIDGGTPTVAAATGLGNTAGIAVTQSGTVYIADPANNRVVIAPTPISFSGTVTNQSASVTGVASTVGLATGQIVTGYGIPTGTAIASIGAGTITLSNVVSTTSTTPPIAEALTALPAPTTTIGTGLSGPMGVAVDSAANVYIADTGNNRILKVNPVTGAQTVLGNYVWIPGSTCYNTVAANNAPDCPATIPLDTKGNPTVTPTTAPPQYAFNHPQGLAVDASNNVYVADTGNSAVVEIPSNIGLGAAVKLLDYAGAPQFANPVAIAVDSQGNIYVADNKVAGSVIVELPPGGGDLVNVPGSQFFHTIAASLSTPNGVAVDAAGNVYVSDSSSSPNAIVEIPSAPGQNPPFALNFPGLNGPAGLALDANGNLYVADSGNKQVLFDYRQSPAINFGNVPQNLTVPAQPMCASTIISDGYNIGNSTPCVLTVTNIGNGSPLALTTPITTVVGTGNIAYATTNTCVSPLPAGATCTIKPTFAPTADNGQTESVTINGGPQAISLTSNGSQPLAGIVLSAAYTGGTSTTAPTPGATATVTATVTQAHISGNVPTGTVTFTYVVNADNNNVNNCGTGGTKTVTLASGVASFALPTLVQGVKYTVTANYTGDSLNTPTQAAPLVVYVPGTPVTATVTSTAAQLTYLYGSPAPVVAGTVTPVPPSPITFSFGSAASATTPIGSYPVILSFSGVGACAYGFPPSLFTNGSPAVVTENPATLTYSIPNFTSLYGAPDITYGANKVVTGLVNGDTVAATFTPASSSILDVGTYSVVPTVTGSKVGNYIYPNGSPVKTTTAPPSTLTISKAPVTIAISAAQTSVLNTAAGVATASYQISIGTAVPAGKGTPSGSVTITDAFTPINATGYGTPTQATIVVPLLAGFGTYTPTDPTAGIHQYSYAYSGDSNFQVSSIAPIPTAAACIPSAIAANCLIVDNPDFTLTSATGPITVIPGVVPSGNGLLSAPNQNSSSPETAVLFVNKVLGFVGQVSLSCQTQNPSYVSCFMTPQSVCFATTSSTACTNTGASAATVLAVQTPATLPLGFKFSSNSRPGMSATRTVLAFLPFGFLAFCVRRRRRLSKALWMLIAITAVSVGMSGCGGNQVSFYTPIPTGPQTVTVTATYLGNGGSQPSATRSFVVPININ
jgi:sugar lactone lactonase YvrE